MMSDLRDLYQEVVFDHNKHPRNFRTLEGANRRAEGHNPLCGDRLTVYLSLEDGVIRQVTFQGSGCAICTASASLMTEALKDGTQAQARSLSRAFHDYLTGESRVPGDADRLGKLKVLGGVRDYPSRVKCATLAWHALDAALDRCDEPVTTE